MIGVVASGRDLETARELFELFKTPWEPAVPGRKYTALLAGDVPGGQFDADVVLVYTANVRADEASLVACRIEGPVEIQWSGSAFPVYGHVVSFAGTGVVGATCAGHSVECESRQGGRTIRRVGYDLLGEIGRLLLDGQPADRALSPTIEWHLALLRAVLVSAGVSFIEVPPRPHGYDFICCLTHDLDFVGIRRHAFDLTMLGFMYRSTIGTFIDLLRGRRSLGEAVRNWMAVLTLPLMFIGLLPDLWRPFDDYSGSEAPHRSTFFVVPFKGRPGSAPDGSIDPQRAVRYQASEIPDDMTAAIRRGSEIALHGIDAWRDSSAGLGELNELKAATGQSAAGVRMHWLYFDRESPARLEAVGFTYDSTWGYNDAVGYRAGTSQVFRLPGTKNLLELPLSIMDSALLFPNRMNLTAGQALQRCAPIVQNAARFGGTLVINWHDRSLAPERLWNRCYGSLLAEIPRAGRVWFATASQAVDWYRWRRSIQFVRHDQTSAVSIVAPARHPLQPPAVLKTHGPASAADVDANEAVFDGGTSPAPAGYPPAERELQPS